jgi:hypothetical protein
LLSSLLVVHVDKSFLHCSTLEELDSIDIAIYLK